MSVNRRVETLMDAAHHGFPVKVRRLRRRRLRILTNAAAETMPSDAARLLSLIRNDFGPAPQSRGA